MWRCDEDDDCSDNSDEDDCREWPAGEEGNRAGRGAPATCLDLTAGKLPWRRLPQRWVAPSDPALSWAASVSSWGPGRSPGLVWPRRRARRAGTVGRDAVVPASI